MTAAGQPTDVTDAVVIEDEPATVASLVPVVNSGALVTPAASEQKILEAFHAYTVLCERLLIPSDYQRIGDKDFRKKSAWRKLAVAFGVSCQILDRAYQRDDQTRITYAEVVIRATAPNGRFMDGIGSCDHKERCCDPKTCPKKTWSSHRCCPADCGGFSHFSHAQHDIPATAATRATNRACADLFGMGEVSAEEVADGDWFTVNGWVNQADHDSYRATVIDKLKAATPAQQTAFKAAREKEGIPGFEVAHTKAQAEWVSSHLFEILEPPHDTEPGRKAGHAIHEAAAKAGFGIPAGAEGETRQRKDAAYRDVLQAAAGKRSSKDFTAAEYKAAIAAFAGLAEGTLEFGYDEDGVPTLIPVGHP